MLCMHNYTLKYECKKNSFHQFISLTRKYSRKIFEMFVYYSNYAQCCLLSFVIEKFGRTVLYILHFYLIFSIRSSCCVKTHLTFRLGGGSNTFRLTQLNDLLMFHCFSMNPICDREKEENLVSELVYENVNYLPFYNCF